MKQVIWTQAPASGKWHVAGTLEELRNITPGIRLLCGWVIHKTDSPKQDINPPVEARCTACLRHVGGRKP